MRPSIPCVLVKLRFEFEFEYVPNAGLAPTNAPLSSTDRIIDVEALPATTWFAIIIETLQVPVTSVSKSHLDDSTRHTCN